MVKLYLDRTLKDKRTSEPMKVNSPNNEEKEFINQYNKSNKCHGRRLLQLHNNKAGKLLWLNC